VPETIPIDGSAAQAVAIKRSKAEHGTTIAIRKRTYLHHLVAQDHSAGKRIPRQILGVKSFETGQSPRAGIERMHMRKQTQLMVEAGDEGRTAAEQCYALAASCRQVTA
jgi:transposase-like protein